MAVRDIIWRSRKGQVAQLCPPAPVPAPGVRVNNNGTLTSSISAYAGAYASNSLSSQNNIGFVFRNAIATQTTTGWHTGVLGVTLAQLLQYGVNGTGPTTNRYPFTDGWASQGGATVLANGFWVQVDNDLASGQTLLQFVGVFVNYTTSAGEEKSTLIGADKAVARIITPPLVGNVANIKKPDGLKIGQATDGALVCALSFDVENIIPANSLLVSARLVAHYGDITLSCFDSMVVGETARGSWHATRDGHMDINAFVHGL